MLSYADALHITRRAAFQARKDGNLARYMRLIERAKQLDAERKAKMGEK